MDMDLNFVILLVLMGLLFIAFGIYLYQKFWKFSGITSGMKLYFVEAMTIRNVFLNSLGIINISRGVSLCFIAVSRYNQDVLVHIFTDFFKEFITLAFGSSFAFVLLIIIEIYRERPNKNFQNAFILIIMITYFLYFIFGIVVISTKFSADNIYIVEESDKFLFAFIYILLGILVGIFGTQLICQTKDRNLTKKSASSEFTPLNKRVFLFSLF